MPEFKLIKISKYDYDLFVSLYCNETMMDFMPKVLTEPEAKELFEQIINQGTMSPPTALIYKLTINSTTDVGLVGGFVVGENKEGVHLGSMILADYQQCGFSTAAIKAFNDVVKTRMKIKFIKTQSQVNNLGATKLMHKLNFMKISTYKNAQGVLMNHWLKEL